MPWNLIWRVRIHHHLHPVLADRVFQEVVLVEVGEVEAVGVGSQILLVFLLYLKEEIVQSCDAMSGIVQYIAICKSHSLKIVRF